MCNESATNFEIIDSQTQSAQQQKIIVIRQLLKGVKKRLSSQCNLRKNWEKGIARNASCAIEQFAQLAYYFAKRPPLKQQVLIFL